MFAAHGACIAGWRRTGAARHAGLNRSTLVPRPRAAGQMIRGAIAFPWRWLEAPEGSRAGSVQPAGLHARVAVLEVASWRWCRITRIRRCRQSPRGGALRRPQPLHGEGQMGDVFLLRASLSGVVSAGRERGIGSPNSGLRPLPALHEGRGASSRRRTSGASPPTCTAQPAASPCQRPAPSSFVAIRGGACETCRGFRSGDRRRSRVGDSR